METRKNAAHQTDLIYSTFISSCTTTIKTRRPATVRFNLRAAAPRRVEPLLFFFFLFFFARFRERSSGPRDVAWQKSSWLGAIAEALYPRASIYVYNVRLARTLVNTNAYRTCATRAADEGGGADNGSEPKLIKAVINERKSLSPRCCFVCFFFLPTRTHLRLLCSRPRFHYRKSYPVRR